MEWRPLDHTTSGFFVLTGARLTSQRGRVIRPPGPLLRDPCRRFGLAASSNSRQSSAIPKSRFRSQARVYVQGMGNYSPLFGSFGSRPPPTNISFNSNVPTMPWSLRPRKLWRNFEGLPTLPTPLRSTVALFTHSVMVRSGPLFALSVRSSLGVGDIIFKPRSPTLK